MATIPRGIQLQSWTNKDGSTSTAYRVRIVRKDFTANQAFTTLQEAKEFLALSKSKKRGREIIYNITKEQEKKREQEREEKYNRTVKHDYSLSYFIEKYIEKYLPEPSKKEEMKKRNWNAKMSFFRTIQKTSIVNRYITHDDAESLGLSLTEGDIHTFFGGFDVRKIKPMEINAYVIERLKTIKKVSVSREITAISNVFKKLKYLDDSLVDLTNPTLEYDKDLTKGQSDKREFTYNEQDEKLLFDMLSKYRNKEIYNIAKLSFLTGLRRSEAVYLKLENINFTNNSIKLFSKGKTRTIYLLPDAQEFIKTLTPYENGRYFKLTTGGFERSFRRLCDSNENTKHLKRFHDIRRTNISRTITKIGLENSVILSTILGMSNIDYLEKTWKDRQEKKGPLTQADAMKNFGHSYAQTTKGYFSFNTHNIKFKGKDD